MQIIDLLWLDVRFCGFTFLHGNCTGVMSGAILYYLYKFHINTGIPYGDSSLIKLKLRHSEKHEQVN